MTTKRLSKSRWKDFLNSSALKKELIVGLAAFKRRLFVIPLFQPMSPPSGVRINIFTLREYNATYCSRWIHQSVAGRAANMTGMRVQAPPVLLPREKMERASRQRDS